MKCSQQCITEKQTKDTMFWHRQSHRNDQWEIAGENVLSFWWCDDKNQCHRVLFINSNVCTHSLWFCNLLYWKEAERDAWAKKETDFPSKQRNTKMIHCRASSFTYVAVYIYFFLHLNPEWLCFLKKSTRIFSNKKKIYNLACLCEVHSMKKINHIAH